MVTNPKDTTPHSASAQGKTDQEKKLELHRPEEEDQPHASHVDRNRSDIDVEPVINEQMTRSREIETVGVEAWKASQDQRPIEEQPVLVKGAIPAGDVLNTPVEGQRRQVPGISHPTAPLPDRAPVRDEQGRIPPGSAR